MDTRLIFVALIAMLFWLAPSPNSTQARQAATIVRDRTVQAVQAAPGIVIEPYVKADHAK